MRPHVFVQDFGLHKRGDVIEIPDDAEVSPQYLAPVEEDSGTGDEDAPTLDELTPPDATDESRGVTEPTDDTKKGKG